MFSLSEDIMEKCDCYTCAFCRDDSPVDEGNICVCEYIPVSECIKLKNDLDHLDDLLHEQLDSPEGYRQLKESCIFYVGDVENHFSIKNIYSSDDVFPRILYWFPSDKKSMDKFKTRFREHMIAFSYIKKEWDRIRPIIEDTIQDMQRDISKLRLNSGDLLSMKHSFKELV